MDRTRTRKGLNMEKKKRGHAPITVELIDSFSGKVYYKGHYWIVPSPGTTVTYNLGKYNKDCWIRIKWEKELEIGKV